MNDDIILSWDAVIEDEGSGGWRLLENGDYNFTVKDYKKSFAKDNKTPVLELTLDVDGIEVRDWLHFKKKAEWKISQFLISIGMKKHGDPTRVDFDRLRGASGRCKIVTNTFSKRDGTEGKGNNVDTYLEPGETPNLAW